MNKDIEKLKRRIDKLLKENKFEKAAVLMEELIANNQDNPMLYSLVARYHFQNEQFERALHLIEKAIDRFPDNPEILNDYAEILFYQDRFEEAEKIMRKLIDFTPEDMKEELSSYYNWLGYALQKQNKIEEAIHAWRTALELYPDNFEAEENLDMYGSKFDNPTVPTWLKENSGLVDDVDMQIEIFEDIDFDKKNKEQRIVIQVQYEIAMQLLDVITSGDMMRELEEFIFADVRRWLLNISILLVRFGMIREAAALGERWTKITNGKDYLANRSVIVAQEELKGQSTGQIAQLCETLSSKWWLTPEEIDAVIDNKEFFQPYLRNALGDRARLGAVPEDPIDSTDSNGVFLLTEFEDTSIVPDLMKCLSMREEDLDIIYADMLTENMWLPFAKLGHKWFDEIWEFVTDTSVNKYARGAAVSGITAMHHFHPDYRAESVSFIERLLRREDVFPADDLAGFLCECADSGLTELTGKAKEFADYMDTQEKVSFPMASADDVRKAFRDGARKDFIKGRGHNVYTINDQWRRIAERENDTKQDINSEISDDEDEKGEFISAKGYNPGKKTGRNDPCPCGSGMKYKKCHGK